MVGPEQQQLLNKPGVRLTAGRPLPSLLTVVLHSS